MKSDYNVNYLNLNHDISTCLQVRIGMDLTKIVLPTFILERRSLLEMYADFFAHPDIFVSIQDKSTPEDRMVQVRPLNIKIYYYFLIKKQDSFKWFLNMWDTFLIMKITMFKWFNLFMILKIVYLLVPTKYLL